MSSPCVGKCHIKFVGLRVSSCASCRLAWNPKEGPARTSGLCLRVLVWVRESEERLDDKNGACSECTLAFVDEAHALHLMGL